MYPELKTSPVLLFRETLLWERSPAFPLLAESRHKPSFRSSLAWLCQSAQHLTRGERSFQVTKVRVQISSCKKIFFPSCKDTSPSGSGPTLSTSFFLNIMYLSFVFLSCGEQGLLFVGVAAFVAEHALYAPRLSRCGTRV